MQRRRFPFAAALLLSGACALPHLLPKRFRKRFGACCVLCVSAVAKQVGN